MQRTEELFTQDEKIIRMINAVLEAISDLSILDLAEIKLFYFHFFQEEFPDDSIEKLPPKLSFILRKFLECCATLSKTADADDVLTFIIKVMPKDAYLLSNEALAKIDILSQFCRINIHCYLLTTLYSAIKIAQSELINQNSSSSLLQTEEAITTYLTKRIEIEYQKLSVGSVSSNAISTFTNQLLSFFSPTKPATQEKASYPSGDTAYVRNVPSMTFSNTGAETSAP